MIEYEDEGCLRVNEDKSACEECKYSMYYNKI